MTPFSLDPSQINQTMMKSFEDMQGMAAAYMSATTKAQKAAWKGFEEIAHDVSGMVEESTARAVAACKTMVAAKSPQEAVETHSEFMKNCFDGLVASSSKMSQTTMRTSKEAIEPLTQHANDAVGSMMKKAAKG